MKIDPIPSCVGIARRPEENVKAYKDLGYSNLMGHNAPFQVTVAQILTYFYVFFWFSSNPSIVIEP